MKKFLILPILALAFVSCETEEDVAVLNESANLTAQIKKSQDVNQSKGVWTTLYTGNQDWHCKGAPKDCAPPIVIGGDPIGNKNDRLQTILTGLKNLNEEEIATNVLINRIAFENIIDSRLLNLVEKNELTVSLKTNSNEKEKFLVFRNKKDNQIIMAYPMNIQ